MSASASRMSAYSTAPSARNDAARSSSAGRGRLEGAPDRVRRRGWNRDPLVRDRTPRPPPRGEGRPGGAGDRGVRGGHDPGPPRVSASALQHQRGRGGAGVLVADAAGPEVAGPALERLHAGWWPRRPSRRPPPRAGGRRPAMPAPRVQRVLVGADRRRQRVDHRLVALGGGAELLDAREGGLAARRRAPRGDVGGSCPAPCRPGGRPCRTAGRRRRRPWRSACCPPRSGAPRAWGAASRPARPRPR